MNTIIRKLGLTCLSFACREVVLFGTDYSECIANRVCPVLGGLYSFGVSFIRGFTNYENTNSIASCIPIAKSSNIASHNYCEKTLNRMYIVRMKVFSNS